MPNEIICIRPNCGNKFVKRYKKKYCSKECGYKHFTEMARIAREELQEKYVDFNRLKRLEYDKLYHETIKRKKT